MATPTRVGRYPVLRELGRGGMGTVYEGWDSQLDRKIAIKVLARQVAGDQERVRRFEREARTLAALSHPNIVTIYSVEKEGPEPFLTMELIEGRALDRSIADGGTSVERFFSVSLPICEAIRAAHERGVVHRDLKPQNVMLREDGTVKLLDFGLARVEPAGDLTRTIDALTAEDRVLGTVLYMSPEQAHGATVDQRTDIWALGVVFYELLTGSRPFSGRTDVAVLYSIVRDDPRPMRALRSDLPAVLERIVDRCLMKSPADRYQDARSLLDDLLRARDESHSTAVLAREGEGTGDPSIAVLPFETLGASEAAVFADGLHSDLLTRLASVGSLRVISRTSMRVYRDTTKPIGQIAAELGVGWVVEGETRQIGDAVQVNVRLVDARSDRQVWAQGFRQQLTAESVFGLQAEIAEKITGDLQLQLTPEERSRLQVAPTANLDAFQLYTQGRRNLELRTESGLRQGLTLFQRATADDADFALAWAGMASALCLFDWYRVAPPDDSPSPLEAARRALDLDPELGQAFVSIGIHHATGLDGPAALRALERAVTLAPNDAEAHIWLAWVLMCLGRGAEATAPARRAVELDPLGPVFRTFLAEILLVNGEPEQALTHATRGRRIEPDYAIVCFVEGLALHHCGRHDDAADRLGNTLGMTHPHSRPTRNEVLAALALAHTANGASERAREIEAEIDPDRQPFSAGLVRAALGDLDGAFGCFSRVVDWGPFTIDIIRGMYPRELATVRGDARYDRLLTSLHRAWGLNPDGSVPTGTALD